MITDMGDGTNILFTSRQLYSDQETGRALSKASTYLQHGATFFSFLGSVAEIGCTLVGGLGGSVALGWADSISPVGDFTGGLAGVAVGAAVGNAIHKGFTNPIETVLSSASTTATLAGDLATGNSNLTIYSSNATITLAESSATSIALTELGNSATVGIEDFAVDLLGSLSSEGAIAGVYGDSQGNILPILPFINFQLGSR